MRCLQILDVNGEALAEHPEIRVGGTYVVLTISAMPDGEVHFRVHHRHRPAADRSFELPPPLWRSAMFEVLSSRIPSSWRVDIGTAGYLRIAPERWHRAGFWDDLIDWSPLSESAVRDYETELEIMLKEAEAEAPRSER